MQTSSDRETLRSGRSGSGGDGCATEQIVGRERRERVSQLTWCGAGCFDSRRRVNSTVIPLRFKTATQQRSVMIQLGGKSIGFRARGWLGLVLSFLNRTGARRARWLGAENPLQCRAG